MDLNINNGFGSFNYGNNNNNQTGKAKKITEKSLLPDSVKDSFNNRTPQDTLKKVEGKATVWTDANGNLRGGGGWTTWDRFKEWVKKLF